MVNLGEESKTYWSAQWPNQERRIKHEFSIWLRSKRPPFAWACFWSGMCFSDLLSARGICFLPSPTKIVLEKRGCIACCVLLVCTCRSHWSKWLFLRQTFIFKSLAHVPKEISTECGCHECYIMVILPIKKWNFSKVSQPPPCSDAAHLKFYILYFGNTFRKWMFLLLTRKKELVWHSYSTLVLYGIVGVVRKKALNVNMKINKAKTPKHKKWLKALKTNHQEILLSPLNIKISIEILFLA